jgi:ribosomal protein S27AE
MDGKRNRIERIIREKMRLDEHNSEQDRCERCGEGHEIIFDAALGDVPRRFYRISDDPALPFTQRCSNCAAQTFIKSFDAGRIFWYERRRGIIWIQFEAASQEMIDAVRKDSRKSDGYERWYELIEAERLRRAEQAAEFEAMREATNQEITA